MVLQVDASARVHPKSHIENSNVGARTVVWQFASIIRGALVCDDCNVGSCSVIDGAVVGNRCLVGHGAQLHPGTLLRDDVFVGPGVVFCNDRFPRVSKEHFEMAFLLDAKSATVVVELGASIGANATILPGVTIGVDAMISAGSVVDRSVPDLHLFKRDGSIVKIDKRQNVRMRFAA